MAWQERLEEILAIEPVGGDRFRASLDGFGGVTLGCATIAASRSCEGRALSSLHSYFLRPVPTDRPAELVVERMRDGRRLAHRRVQIRADDKLCGELVASFAVPGEGAEFGDARVDPETPAPGTLPTEDDVARQEGWTVDQPGPLYGPLDQVLWLHRDLPWDGWRLITTECDVAHGGRALSRRMLFTPEGTLVASMAQEQLIPPVGRSDLGASVTKG